MVVYLSVHNTEENFILTKARDNYVQVHITSDMSIPDVDHAYKVHLKSIKNW